MKKKQAAPEQGRYSKRTIAIAGCVVTGLDLVCIVLMFLEPLLAAYFTQIIITLATAWCVMFGEYTYNSVASKKIDGPYAQQCIKDIAALSKPTNLNG